MTRTAAVSTAAVLLLAIAAGGWKLLEVRAQKHRETCIQNLRKLDEAKMKWGWKKRKGAAVDEQEINGMLADADTSCPAGGLVSYGKVGFPPTCTRPGHVISDWKDYTLTNSVPTAATNSAEALVPQVSGNP